MRNSHRYMLTAALSAALVVALSGVAGALTNPVVDFGAASYAKEGTRTAGDHTSTAGDMLTIVGKVVVFNDPFADLDPNLPGLSRQGGFEAVDASSHSATADSLNGFMFGSGPSRRFIGVMDPAGVEAQQVIPGGQSGVFYHPNYASQLPLWLVNDYHPMAQTAADAAAVAVRMSTFGPVE